MAIVMALVWPCQESTVEATRTPSGRSNLATSRSTIVDGVVDGLVAGREDHDEGIVVRRVRRRALLALGSPDTVVALGNRGEAALQKRHKQFFDDTQERRVDVGSVGCRKAVDFEQDWRSCGDGLPYRGRSARQGGQLDAAITWGGDAVQ